MRKSTGIKDIGWVAYRTNRKREIEREETQREKDSSER